MTQRGARVEMLLRSGRGGGMLPHTLYMGAVTAKETNEGCKALFDRLVAKEENRNPAVIAVAKKLLKYVYGVVKSECLFDRNFNGTIE